MATIEPGADHPDGDVPAELRGIEYQYIGDKHRFVGRGDRNPDQAEVIVDALQQRSSEMGYGGDVDAFTAYAPQAAEDCIDETAARFGHTQTEGEVVGKKD